MGPDIFYALTAHTSDLVAILEADGAYRYASPSFQRMLGYSPSDLRGTSVFEHIHPDDAGRVRAAFASAMQVDDGAPMYVQSRFRHADGSWRVLATTGSSYLADPVIHGFIATSQDITEQVAAVNQLRETEAQYRDIFEAIGDGLVIADMDSMVVEANPAFCRMFGYSHDEFLGHQVVLRPALGSGPYQAQAMNRRKDGSGFTVEGHAVTFTYKGTPHILGVVRDITERVQAEEQLRQKEAQYRAIFEATGDGLVILDQQGAVVEANPAFCAMYGYAHDEVIGQHNTKFVHPSQHLLLAQHLQAVMAGEPVQEREIGVRKNGSQFHVEAHATPFVYKDRPHVLGVDRDISERVEAEERLQEAEGRYRSIFESSLDGLCIVDFDGRFVEVNPAFCAIYGYQYDVLIGQHSSTLARPEDHNILADAMQSIAAGGSYHIQSVGPRKDGTLFHAEAHGSAFTYKGTPHLFGVVRDVTERVRSQELLEQRVAERTRELSGLLDVSRNVASTLELQPLLDLILDQLQAVVDYVGAGITVQDGTEVRVIGYRGPGPNGLALGTRLPVTQVGPLWQLMRQSEPVSIADVQADTPEAHIYRETVGDALRTSFGYIRSWMAVPMRVKDRDIGSLFLEHSEPGIYTAHHVDLALAIAQQAAIAIENARLYEQAQELAVLEERQRLARELHDSVSQALYGIALGVRTAQLQREREPGRLAESLEYVLSLAQTGLAEMRSLIFELLPEALATEGLVMALRKQTAAIQARHELTITAVLGEEPEAPITVKEALYRIAQEALHNTVKHAQAQVVAVRLEAGQEELTLEVGDDGAGFETGGSFPGHLGLRTMRERATKLGGTLEVESTPGLGTRIRVRIPSRAAGERR